MNPEPPRLEAVLDHLLCFVAVLTPEGVLVECSGALAVQGGPALDEFRGRPFWECPWWSFSAVASAMMRSAVKLAAQGILTRKDMVAELGPGRLHSFDFMLTAMRSEDGRVTHLIASGVDITSRKAAEQALRQTHESMLLAQSASGIGVWDWDLTHDTAYVSPQYRQLYGFASDTVITHETWLNVIHPHDRPKIALDVARLMDFGSEWQAEFRIFHPQHGRRWLVSYGRLMRDANGRATRFAGLNVDITERKQAELALRRMAALVELSHDAFFAWSSRGGIELWNRGAVEIYGFQKDEALGRRPHELLRTGFVTPWHQILEELREHGIWEGEMRHYTKAGAEVVVSSRLQHVPGAEDVMLILETDRNMTRSRELERELLEIRGREQRRIGQDLHDDLCQWLTGIELLTQSLADRLADIVPVEAAQAAKIADHLRHATTKARSLARGLMPVSMELGLAAALAQLATQSAQMWEIECLFDGLDTHVKVNNAELALNVYRIAQEATSNAVKHGGATSVHVSLAPQEGRVALHVRDNGRSIPLPLPETAGMGLRIMRYRAGIIGATLDIRPVPEGGTLVECLFPAEL